MVASLLLQFPRRCRHSSAKICIPSQFGSRRTSPDPNWRARALPRTSEIYCFYGWWGPTAGIEDAGCRAATDFAGWERRPADKGQKLATVFYERRRFGTLYGKAAVHWADCKPCRRTKRPEVQRWRMIVTFRLLHMQL